MRSLVTAAVTLIIVYVLYQWLQAQTVSASGGSGGLFSSTVATDPLNLSLNYSGDSTGTASAPSFTSSVSDGLDNFMQGISNFEGTGRSTRNNNPGNLKAPGGDPSFWSGQVGVDPQGFAIFSDIGDGWTALQKDIATQARRNPLQSFYDFFGTYSPDGNSDSYAQYVAGYMGVDPNTPIGSVLGG